jgi:hypothetical protein
MSSTSGRSLVAAAGVVTAALALAAPAAQAFVRTTTDRGAAVYWRSSCIYITAHAIEVPDYLTTDSAISAARAAAAAWSVPGVSCTALQMQVALSQAPDSVVANDGHSNLLFRQGTWCRDPLDPSEPCYDKAALAITTVFAQQNDGLVLDADTEINAVDFRWGDLVDGSAVGDAQDLQNTLTHEFGHLLGLDHNCYSPSDRGRGIDQNGMAVPDCIGAPADVRQATMYAAVVRGDVQRRTLSPDDIAGVCAIYPAGAGPSSCQAVMDGDPPAQRAESHGGCSIGRGAGRPALATFMGLGLLAILAGGRLSGRRRGG